MEHNYASDNTFPTYSPANIPESHIQNVMSGEVRQGPDEVQILRNADGTCRFIPSSTTIGPNGGALTLISENYESITVRQRIPLRWAERTATSRTANTSMALAFSPSGNADSLHPDVTASCASASPNDPAHSLTISFAHP
jgi:hypothetical protein